MKRALRLDSTMLIIILTRSREPVGVPRYPGYLIYPPASVIQVRLGSSFAGGTRKLPLYGRHLLFCALVCHDSVWHGKCPFPPLFFSLAPWFLFWLLGRFGLACYLRKDSIWGRILDIFGVGGTPKFYLFLYQGQAEHDIEKYQQGNGETLPLPVWQYWLGAGSVTVSFWQ